MDAIRILISCYLWNYVSIAFNVENRSEQVKLLRTNSYKNLAHHVWGEQSQQDNVLDFPITGADARNDIEHSRKIKNNGSVSDDIRIRYGCHIFNSSHEPDAKCTNDFLLDFPSSNLNMSSRGLTSINVKNEGDNSNILICRPQSEQTCDNLSYVPGACFITTVNRSQVSSGNGSFPAWREIAPCWQSCYPTVVDLAFVIDGSSSVRRNNFQGVLNWMKDVVNDFDVSGPYRIAVVKYSRRRVTRVEIQLGQYKTHTALREVISNIKYNPGGSAASYAINLTVNNVFNSKFGRFPQARRIMIFLTDGKSSDSG